MHDCVPSVLILKREWPKNWESFIPDIIGKMQFSAKYIYKFFLSNRKKFLLEIGQQISFLSW